MNEIEMVENAKNFWLSTEIQRCEIIYLRHSEKMHLRKRVGLDHVVVAYLSFRCQICTNDEHVNIYPQTAQN